MFALSLINATRELCDELMSEQAKSYCRAVVLVSVGKKSPNQTFTKKLLTQRQHCDDVSVVLILTFTCCVNPICDINPGSETANLNSLSMK